MIPRTTDRTRYLPDLRRFRDDADGNNVDAIAQNRRRNVLLAMLSAILTLAIAVFLAALVWALC